VPGAITSSGDAGGEFEICSTSPNDVSENISASTGRRQEGVDIQPAGVCAPSCLECTHRGQRPWLWAGGGQILIMMGDANA
jgi:hypothetical protein